MSVQAAKARGAYCLELTLTIYKPDAQVFGGATLFIGPFKNEKEALEWDTALNHALALAVDHRSSEMWTLKGDIESAGYTVATLAPDAERPQAHYTVQSRSALPHIGRRYDIDVDTELDVHRIATRLGALLRSKISEALKS